MPQKSPQEWLSALPGDATLYASLSVPKSAELIKKALKQGGPGLQDVAGLVERTKSLYCAVKLLPGAPPRFSALALGEFPSFFVGMRLSGSRDWKQIRGPAGTYWEWNKASLQVGTQNDFILLASNGELEALQRRYAAPIPLRMPPEAAAEMAGTDLVLYMPELPGGLSRASPAKDGEPGMKIPIQETWVTAIKGPDGYRLEGTANTESEKSARLLVIILRLGIVTWMKTQNVSDVTVRLKSITVTSNGNRVKLAGLTILDAEVVPLLLSLLQGMAAEPGSVTASAGGSPSVEAGQ
jgi:hypothetical protein